MIQAKELMIGSFVSTKAGIGRVNTIMDCMKRNSYHRWVSLRMFNGQNRQFTLGEISPIPLTPEILEKAGWRKDVQEMYWTECLGFSYLGWKNGVLSLFIHSDTRTLEEPMPHIKQLHQLQNLYYSLTGQDLQITF